MRKCEKKLIPGLLALGLLGVSPISSAAVYDFQQWVDDNAEQGFDNATPFTIIDAGLTLTATAFEADGSASNVYMDDFFNGAIGGMGVCTTLDNLAQCDPSSDDNVSGGEILSWDFSQGVNSLTLELGTDDHQKFTNSAIEYSLDNGSSWTTAITDGSAKLTILLSGDTGVDFRTAGATLADQFYIQNANASVVPVPAAVWLFGSGLIGLVGVARRRKS